MFKSLVSPIILFGLVISQETTTEQIFSSESSTESAVSTESSSSELSSNYTRGPPTCPFGDNICPSDSYCEYWNEVPVCHQSNLFVPQNLKLKCWCTEAEMIADVNLNKTESVINYEYSVNTTDCVSQHDQCRNITGDSNAVCVYWDYTANAELAALNSTTENIGYCNSTQFGRSNIGECGDACYRSGFSMTCETANTVCALLTGLNDSICENGLCSGVDVPSINCGCDSNRTVTPDCVEADTHCVTQNNGESSHCQYWLSPPRCNTTLNSLDIFIPCQCSDSSVTVRTTEESASSSEAAFSENSSSENSSSEEFSSETTVITP